MMTKTELTMLAMSLPEAWTPRGGRADHNAAKIRRRGQSRLRRGLYLADIRITVANPNLGRDRGV